MQGESSEGGESTAGVSTTVAPTSSGAVPFFAEGEAPAGLEHIGFCSVP